MGLEQALYRLGKFGKWQTINYCLVGLSFGLTANWQMFAIVFIGYYNSHHCAIGNLTTLEELRPYLPTEQDCFGFDIPAMCHQYRVANGTIDNRTELTCQNGYRFYDEGFAVNGTIVEEWGLICDKDIYVEISQTLFNVGIVAGFLFFTPFGDKYGRKKMFFICQFFMMAFGIAMAFAPIFELFCTFQFLTGACAAGLYLTGCVLACEIFPSELRSYLAPATSLFLAVGMMSLSGWAYLLRDWRQLQFSISICGLLPMFYWWMCPESLRWLIANDRFAPAMKTLKTAAKWNNVDMPDNILADEEKAAQMTNKPKDNMLDFIKSPKPRRYLLIMMYNLFTDNMMYFGLSLMSGNMAGMDTYMSFFVNAAVEIPGILVAIVAMAFFGRRIPIAMFHLLAGSCMGLCAVFAAVPMEGVDNETIMTVFSLLGKCFVAAAWSVELVYAQEIFPTNVRNTGLGIAGGMGYVGSIVAPYTSYLYRIVRWGPGTIFGVFAVISGFLTLLLPETLGRDLPDSVEEVASWPLTISKEEKLLLLAIKRKRQLDFKEGIEMTEHPMSNSTKGHESSNDKRQYQYSNNGYATHPKVHNNTTAVNGSVGQGGPVYESVGQAGPGNAVTSEIVLNPNSLRRADKEEYVNHPASPPEYVTLVEAPVDHEAQTITSKVPNDVILQSNHKDNSVISTSL